MSDESWPVGRTFQAAQPWRTLMRLGPWWMALVGTIGLIILGTAMWPGALEEGGPSIAFVAVFTILWIAVPLINVRQLRRTVVSIEIAADSLVLDRALGDDVMVAAHELESLDRARFLPQPGWLRLRDTQGRKWSLAPVDDEFALTDLLRAIVEK